MKWRKASEPPKESNYYHFKYLYGEDERKATFHFTVGSGWSSVEKYYIITRWLDETPSPTSPVWPDDKLISAHFLADGFWPTIEWIRQWFKERAGEGEEAIKIKIRDIVWECFKNRLDEYGIRDTLTKELQELISTTSTAGAKEEVKDRNSEAISALKEHTEKILAGGKESCEKYLKELIPEEDPQRPTSGKGEDHNQVIADIILEIKRSPQIVSEQKYNDWYKRILAEIAKLKSEKGEESLEYWKEEWEKAAESLEVYVQIIENQKAEISKLKSGEQEEVRKLVEVLEEVIKWDKDSRWPGEEVKRSEFELTEIINKAKEAIKPYIK